MISLHELFAANTIKVLRSLKAIIAKAEATSGFDVAALPETRLTADMLPFAFQVQLICNLAKKGISRLQTDGVNVPVADDEKTVAQLIERMDATIALLEAFKAEDMIADDKMVELKLGDRPAIDLTSKDYVLNFILPNVFFHLQTAYCILRMKGVEIGKADYLGPFMTI